MEAFRQVGAATLAARARDEMIPTTAEPSAIKPRRGGPSSVDRRIEDLPMAEATHRRPGEIMRGCFVVVTDATEPVAANWVRLPRRTTNALRVAGAPKHRRSVASTTSSVSRPFVSSEPGGRSKQRDGWTSAVPLRSAGRPRCAPSPTSRPRAISTGICSPLFPAARRSDISRRPNWPIYRLFVIGETGAEARCYGRPRRAWAVSWAGWPEPISEMRPAPKRRRMRGPARP